MGVSTPTANSMVKRLQEQGWVQYEKYKPLKLTPEGQREAALIIRRHRIAEMFLVEQMGLGWENVHDIAEELEHVDSDLFFDRMNEMLDYPEVDPHGSPIPDRNGKLKPNDDIPLSELEEGQRAQLCSIHQSTSEFLVLLNKKDIALGIEFHVLEKEPFDLSMKVSYEGHEAEILSHQVCERLCVKVV